MDNPYLAPIEVATNDGPKVLHGPAGSDVCPNCDYRINRKWVAFELPSHRCRHCAAKLSMDIFWGWKYLELFLFIGFLACWFYLGGFVQGSLFKVALDIAAVSLMVVAAGVIGYYALYRFGYPIARL